LGLALLFLLYFDWDSIKNEITKIIVKAQNKENKIRNDNVLKSRETKENVRTNFLQTQKIKFSQLRDEGLKMKANEQKEKSLDLNLLMKEDTDEIDVEMEEDVQIKEFEHSGEYNDGLEVIDFRITAPTKKPQKEEQVRQKNLQEEEQDIQEWFEEEVERTSAIVGSPRSSNKIPIPKAQKKESKLDVTEDKYKLVVLGGGGVGKSCLVLSYLYDQFIEEYDPTIENVFPKIMKIGGCGYLVEITDTAGQDQFQSLRDIWVQEGDGFMIVFDLTDSKTFQEVNAFFDLISILKPYSPVVLFGNKLDLLVKQKREMSKEELDKYSISKKCVDYVEGSALTKKKC